MAITYSKEKILVFDSSWSARNNDKQSGWNGASGFKWTEDGETDDYQKNQNAFFNSWANSAPTNDVLYNAIAAVEADDTVEDNKYTIELVSTGGDIGLSTMPHATAPWWTYDEKGEINGINPTLGDGETPRVTLTKDYQFVTESNDDHQDGEADHTAKVTLTGTYINYIQIQGNFYVGKNVTLDFAPVNTQVAGQYLVEGFLQVQNLETSIEMTIDGTFINAGGDFGVPFADDNTATVTLNVSKTGKFLARSCWAGNCDFYSNTIIKVEGNVEDATALTKEYIETHQADELQFTTSCMGSIKGKATFEDSFVQLGSDLGYGISGDKTFKATNSVLISNAESTAGKYAGITLNKETTLKKCNTIFGSLAVTGKTLTIDGGKMLLTNADATSVAEGATLTVTDATFEQSNPAATFTNSGTITVTNSTFTAGAFANNGTLTLDYTKTFTVKSLTAGENSSIKFDMKGATDKSYVLIDVAEGTAAYQNSVTIDNLDAKYTQADKAGDLYVLDTTYVTVNTAWTGEASVADVAGAVWNVNAFGSLEAAAAAYNGTRVFSYIAEKDQMLDIVISMEEGSSTVSFGTASSSKNYTVTSSKTITAEITAGTEYILSFTGDNAKYNITTNATASTTPKDVEVDLLTKDTYTDSETTTVGYCTEAGKSSKEYDFSVAAGYSGEYTITIDITEPAYETADRITYSLYNKETGKKYAYGSTTKDVTRTVSLTEGAYILSVDSYDHGAGKYETTFKVSIDAKKYVDVSAEDDAFSGATKLAAGGNSGTKFVGYADKTDWFKLVGSADATALEKSGQYTITVDKADADSTIASGLRVYLYQIDDNGKKTAIKSATYKNAAVAFTNVMLDATKNYYVQVTAPNANSTKYNATYKVALSACTAEKGISSADDNWKTTTNELVADGGSDLSDWVGTEDTVDYVKLTNMTAGTTYNLGLNVEADGSRVTATLYRKKTKMGTLSSVCTFNLNGGAAAHKEIACASGYDYYLRIKSAAGTGVSNGYNATLAAVN